MSSGPIRARLASATTISSDVTDLRFAVETPPSFSFIPGQFVTFSVGTDAQGQAVRRSYSLASSARQGRELRLLIKLLPDGAAHDFFAGLEPGHVVDMTGPHGFFALDPQHHGDVVFAATGTGLAPILPMLEEIAQRDEPNQRYLFWGLRSVSDLFLRDELEALCVASRTQLAIYLSRPDDTWHGPRGRIVDPVLAKLSALRDPTFYMVGNGAMIKELKQRLIEHGINRKKHIRTEAFFD